MKRARRALALAACALALAACGATSDDLKGVDGKHPDRVELYVNVDGHPNLVRLCIGGIAFLTTSRDKDAVMRIPEWDSWCAGGGR